MLLQVITQHPEAIPVIQKSTPTWVWGLLTSLLVLGASQVRDRTASLARSGLMPVAMTGFSIWGTASAFAASSGPWEILATWLGAALAVFAAVASFGSGRSAASYDAATRRFHIPGSYLPLLLILGVFLTKYVVGVELGMQPGLAHDSSFALPAAALYGAFSGLFTGRAARLWRLVADASRAAQVRKTVVLPRGLNASA